MDVTTRPYWPVAKCATDLGLDVVVTDPEADEIEEFWDQVDGHGTLVLVPYSGAGWDLKVGEPEHHVS